MDLQMKPLRITPKPQIGMAFESSGPTLLQGWTKSHGVRMLVELDHAMEGDECEDVVVFYAKDRSLRRGILWRSATEIVAQPLIGRTSRFGSETGSDCRGHGSLPAPMPHRSKSQSATPHRAKWSGDVDDSGASAGNASPSIR
jgi:hypothetical protein